MTTAGLQRLADEEPMHLVQQGEPRAFEVVYDRHGGAAFSLAYRMVGNRAAAEVGLAYLGGFTHTQIAEVLKMPIGTVKGRMRLGLEKMRRQLAGEMAYDH